MSNPIYTIFCDRVCSVIRWKAARKPARAELTAHLEDHADVLTAQGVPPEVTARRAVEAMGDPYALGHQLDQCHSPPIPRLSRIFMLLAVLIALLGTILGVSWQTGLFACTSLFPQQTALPYDGEDTVVCAGTATGGGTLSGYRLSPTGDAGLVLVDWPLPDQPLHQAYQVQCPVIITNRHPLQSPMSAYQADARWTDDLGNSGIAIFVEDTQALLGSTAWLRITDPPPGARQFTVTLSSTQQRITLRITLEKEVPQP